MTPVRQSITLKERVIGFVWQHILLLVSLFFMTLGVALCVRSDLGSSVISSCPLAFTVAGADRYVPALTLGTYTNILNFMLVAGQVIVLGSKFKPVQLFQLLIGFVFGALIDLNMMLTASIMPVDMTAKCFWQFAGCTVMAVGIAFEVRCGSITMPGEGLPLAIERVTGKPFGKVKIYVDCIMVAMAVVSCYIFFGEWRWNIVGIGTLFAMLYVGALVRFLSRYLSWFDRIVAYRPGFRRYIFGLARYLNPKKY